MSSKQWFLILSMGFVIVRFGHAQSKLYFLDLKTTENFYNVVKDVDKYNYEDTQMPGAAPTLWVLDANGGYLESGDIVYIYNYSDYLDFDKSDHIVQIWHPIEWWQYNIGLIEAGAQIFNGQRLSLSENDTYSLVLVNLDHQDVDQTQMSSILASSE
jgi:hypothetical protein